MAQESAISWTDSTFNPWIGCTKVGPACDGCYADALMGQGGRHKRATWGGPGQRSVLSRTAPSTWAAPVKWNKAQGAAVEAWEAVQAAHDAVGSTNTLPRPAPWFVFCASLSDVFDKDAPVEWRRDLFDLIRATPHLTYLLLTKRPQNIVKLFTAQASMVQPFPASNFAWPRNAAIGCTVVTQAEADRDVPHLLKAAVALNPAFTFLSMEPLLEAVDLRRLSTMAYRGGEGLDALTGSLLDFTGWSVGHVGARVDWVITGGETDQGGHKARPTPPGAFASLRDQCSAAGVPLHHKQNGEWSQFGVDQLADGSLNLLGRPDDVTTGQRVQLGDAIMQKVGKAKSGRLLDGVEHNARPVPR